MPRDNASVPGGSRVGLQSRAPGAKRIESLFRKRVHPGHVSRKENGGRGGQARKTLRSQLLENRSSVFCLPLRRRAGERHLGPTGELLPAPPGLPEPPGRGAALGSLPGPSGQGLPPVIIIRMSVKNKGDLASDIKLNP